MKAAAAAAAAKQHRRPGPCHAACTAEGATTFGTRFIELEERKTKQKLNQPFTPYCVRDAHRTGDKEGETTVYGKRDTLEAPCIR